MEIKAEINNENKAKFFAQYWGQRLIDCNRYAVPVALTSILVSMPSTDFESIIEQSKILLKPLSSISDEDANELYKILHPKDNYATEYQIKEAISWLQDEFGISTIKHKWDCIHASDYLRSKGYALPYFGLSVEEMVEAGWIKLNE